MNDKEFIKNLIELQNGNKGALERIYNEYYINIFYTAYNLCHSRDIAQDVAMDVMLKLCNYSDDPHAIKNHMGFLVTITQNQTKDYLKKIGRETALDNHACSLKAETVDETLFLEDIYKVLDELEKVIFTEHIIWDKTLNLIAREQ